MNRIQNNVLFLTLSLVILLIEFVPTLSQNPQLNNYYENPYVQPNMANWLENTELPDEQKLIQELLTHYDSAARPVFNASESVKIKFSLSLIQISDMVSYLLFGNIFIFKHKYSNEF